MHVLLIEDQPGDARLLRELLAEAGPGRFALTHVERLQAGIDSLSQAAFDIILLDLSLPDSQGAETLSRMHAAAHGIPIVLMTGLDDEELGLRLIQAGAQDYLIKGQVTAPLLVRALNYAVQRNRLERELREKTRLVQSVLDGMAEGVVMADETGTFQVWNAAAERIIGSGPTGAAIGQWSERYGFFLPDGITSYPTHDLPLARAIRGESVNNVLVLLRRPGEPDGAYISVNARPLLDETGQLKGGVAVFRDITLARRTEEALRETQEQYRLLVTRANDIIYRTDATGRFTFVNPVAMRIMKYEEHELLGRRFLDLIHPAHREAADRFYGRQFLRRQPTTYYEFLAVAKDGSEVWIGQNVQILLEDDRVVGFQAVARDITERKRAQEALLESEERFRSIVQSTSDAIILIDTDGTVVFWNSGAAKIFGYPAAEIIGRPVTDIIPERFREAHRKGVQRVAAAGALTVQSTMFELIGLRRDGTEFPLEFSLAAWATKSGLFITGIIRDITARKRAESALRESEERFRTIMDNSPALIFIKDVAGRYLQVNRRFETIFHLAGAAILGKTDDEVFPPEQAAAFRANDRKVLEAGAPMEFEETALHDDGPHTSIVVKFPLFNAAGSCYALCGIATDITDRKRAEEERQKLAKDRLLLLESTGEGIYGLDGQGRCTFVNKAAARMLGYHPDELLGEDMHERIHHSFGHGAPYPREQCRIYETFTRGKGCQVDDEVYWRKDGTSFPVEYSSFPVLEHDRITGAVIIFLDITLRKRLEEERSQRAARLLAQQSTLTELTQSRLFQGSSLTPTLQHITELTARTLGIERVSIWRFTEDRTAIQCVDLYRLESHRHASEVTVMVSSCPVYFKALASSQIIAADDACTDERTAEFAGTYLTKLGISSMMDVPLYLFGQLEGVICHEHIGPIRRWTEDEQMFALAVSNLVALAYEQAERRRAEEQLEQSQQRLRSLTARLESVREEERIRIAREIHDELGQSLTGVKLELALLRDQIREARPAQFETLESIFHLVDATIQSVRRIATDLRPVVLDQLGLIPAIEWQAQEFQSRTGIRCTLNIYLRSVALSLTGSTAMFRIFQEILTNVARHAQASTVTINLQEQAGSLVLEVRDDGRGVTAEELSDPKSLGLVGMRERALLLGGETAIMGTPGSGTTVRVRIPFDRLREE